MKRHPKFRVVVLSSVGPCNTYKSSLNSSINFISNLFKECSRCSFSSSFSYDIQRYDSKLNCYITVISSSVNFKF